MTKWLRTMIVSIISTYGRYRITPRNDKLIIDTLMVSRFRTSCIKLQEIQSRKDTLLVNEIRFYQIKHYIWDESNPPKLAYGWMRLNER